MNNELIIQCRLPAYLAEYYRLSEPFPALDDRIRLTLELARRNIAEGAGGPFSAILFERGNHRLYAAGVNVVAPNNLSFAHAEITALAAAQQKAGSYDLSALNLELVCSCEPCAMCYGAALWSGLRSLVYCATGEAAEEAGFREGHKPADWAAASRDYGIEVTGPVRPEDGRAVLLAYAAGGGLIYNAATRQPAGKIGRRPTGEGEPA